MRDAILQIIWWTDLIIVTFLLTYNGLHVLFTFVAFMDVREWIARPLWEDREQLYLSPFLPSITLLVPAYNEEVTIVESLRSLLRLQYPRFEIVIVNDGSKDQTVQVLKDAFGFVRADIDYHPKLPSARVRGLYEAPMPEGTQALRLVLIDKENGGKADALNAAINASKGDFVCSMDADSLLVPDALVQLIIPILEDVNATIAVGGQVVASNGCEVGGGRLIKAGLPESWLARFQFVEYIRSFTQGRTALNRYNAVLILSGVCAIFQRDLLMRVGGFLTPRMTNRIGIEYCGEHAETVCEDMEVVLRLHRYLIDTGMYGRVIFFPMPIAWTEVPEVAVSLGKQRGRWYRGLWECLTYHRDVLFRPRYKHLGLFSLPYQFLFEAVAPLLEGIGYLIVPVTWFVGILDTFFLMLFLATAIGFNILVSSVSVVICLWSEGRFRRGNYAPSLLPFSPWEITKLVFYGILSNFGYRQYIVWYQLKGFKDFLAGKKSWDKFARKGFQATSNA